MSQYKITKTEAEWRAQLDALQFEVSRKGATERAYTGKYDKHSAAGMYNCVCCNTPLFESVSKFDSGCGWPSYFQPAADGAIEELADTSHGMRRVEVRCQNCGAHLGHVFEDGPEPTGLRYCINSASIDFKPA